MMNTLKDKTILITGASSGFGRAIALALAPLNGRVIIAARREQPLRQLSEQLTKLDCQNHVMVLDVAETVLFCLTRPPHVNINDITLYPTAQASATQVARTDKSVGVS